MSGVLIKQTLQMLLKISKPSLSRQSSKLTSGSDTETGFTLIEVIVVILIIAVLATIIGPSWLGFLRQRQATAIRDEILSILQTAQSEAKRTNRSRTVEFDASLDPPEFSVYIPGVAGTTTFTQLGRDKELESGQVEISLPNSLKSITFDYQGVPDFVTDTTDTPIQVERLTTDDILTVTVTPSETVNEARRRCVIIQTLLGGMRASSGSECGI